MEKFYNLGDKFGSSLNLLAIDSCQSANDSAYVYDDVLFTHWNYFL